MLDIYRSPRCRSRCHEAYANALSHWPLPFEETDVPTPFGATHVIVSGPVDAPPLVLLHGQWSTSTMWVPLVERLGAGSRLYAIDQIDDVGRSVPTRLPASGEEYADWLLAVLDDLCLGSVDLAGLSYGGFLATSLALRAPARVRRLILLCPGLPSFGRPTGKWALHGLPITVLPARRAAVWLVEGLSVRGYRRGDPEAEQLIAGATGVRARVPMRPDVGDDQIASLAMPVLFVVGDGEAMYDPARAAQSARRLIPSVETAVIHGCGHMLCTDQPDQVAAEMVEFLCGPDSAVVAGASNKGIEQSART